MLQRLIAPPSPNLRDLWATNSFDVKRRFKPQLQCQSSRNAPTAPKCQKTDKQAGLLVPRWKPPSSFQLAELLGPTETRGRGGICQEGLLPKHPTPPDYQAERRGWELLVLKQKRVGLLGGAPDRFIWNPGGEKTAFIYINPQKLVWLFKICPQNPSTLKDRIWPEGPEGLYGRFHAVYKW